MNAHTIIIPSVLSQAGLWHSSTVFRSRWLAFHPTSLSLQSNVSGGDLYLICVLYLIQALFFWGGLLILPQLPLTIGIYFTTCMGAVDQLAVPISHRGRTKYYTLLLMARMCCLLTTISDGSRRTSMHRYIFSHLNFFRNSVIFNSPSSGQKFF